MPLHSTLHSTLLAGLLARLREWFWRLRGDALDALAVVLPVTCASCGGVDRAFCRACAEALAALAATRECQLKVVAGDGRGIPVVAAADYDGPVKSLLASFKERGRVDAARPLAVLLRRSVATLAHVAAADASTLGRPSAWVAVLAPSSPKSLRARGYSHLAVVWSLAVPGAASAQGLRLTRAVRDQAGLSVSARSANLRNAYVADRALTGARVVIVDDVVTSGATLREAIRALEEVGAVVVGCVVIAETVRRSPSSGGAELDTRGA